MKGACTMAATSAGLTTATSSAAAADQTFTEWDYEEYDNRNFEHWQGTYIVADSEYAGSGYYDHEFVFSTYSGIRRDFDGEYQRENWIDRNSLHVNVWNGPEDINWGHTGASGINKEYPPQNTSCSSEEGEGDPKSGGKLDAARDVIMSSDVDPEMNPPAWSNDVHTGNYVLAGEVQTADDGESSSLYFNWQQTPDIPYPADVAHQAYLTVRTDYSADFLITDMMLGWREIGVRACVSTSGTDKTIDVYPDSRTDHEKCYDE